MDVGILDVRLQEVLVENALDYPVEQRQRGFLQAMDLPDQEIRKLIDHSYELVVASLTKKDREKLQQREIS